MTDLTTVRCYRCGHQYAADANRLDTCCLQCGSDSYVKVRDQ